MTFTADDLYEAYLGEEKEWSEFGEGFELHGLGQFEGVEEYGRDLMNPSTAYQVVKHVDSGRHFKIEGYYDSWSGSTWDVYKGDLAEVTKQTRTYEVWE